MKMINIIIDDDNSYFSAGLQSSINEYARLNNKSVFFLKRNAVIRPDVVFVSTRRGSQSWRRTAYDNGRSPVVTITERPVVATNPPPRVLYRTDRPAKLFELLAEVLANTRSERLFDHSPLTLRERQVMGYLRRGLDQSQTARVLGVSVKTIHSHKRSVMSKMMLSRSHDFIYWLLSHEEEYS
ncbi:MULTISPECIES: LuxR C-terminal-related transcriptional regulator [Serratia]|uniref:helix-turn-helix transcriptional regulator n=1 Tax=Serratia TaxID=613 RepID=UPI0018D5EF18|nr:helix-turn-helix transcriptional regulator [Serratia marcescens]MBH2805004.1 helix-turn-helix transcriptional regulator [Serratia marcescens]MBH2959805.1 helix-turn-helix transcriptional regulator [Serratia marcescens]MBN5234098.1 helix-turn-helix transcriptional regulator [Serratia marcescens]